MIAKQVSTPLSDLVKYYDDFVFLVDFDGTMVELVPHPEDVVVPPALLQDIETIVHRGKIAFAIVTGRSIGRLDRFLENIQTPVIGGHGAECRLNGASNIEFLAVPFSADMLSAIQAVGDRHDCIFENKVYSLSVHLPHEHIAKDLAPEILTALGASADDYLIRKAGRTYEILWRGITKGTGIAHLMKQPQFATRKPVYIGDDAYTDESLQLVRDMGGELLHVKNSQYTPADTDGVLLEVSDVRQILFDLARIT